MQRDDKKNKGEKLSLNIRGLIDYSLNRYTKSSSHLEHHYFFVTLSVKSQFICICL